MSDEHLSTEEISGLLDRGAGEASGSGHLEDCPSCRREMELLRRMRMALSALNDREAPPAAWSSLETELERRELVEPSSGGDEAGRRERSLAEAGWLRAAAAAVLFVGGLGLGSHLASPGEPAAGGDGRTAATAQPEASDAASGSEGAALPADPAPADPTTGSGLPAAVGSGAGADDVDGLTYRRAMARLEELRARGPTFDEAYRDPEAAAEHMARLEALMRASQEALREDPADPALNDFLFEVAEERRTLSRALQLSSLEYR